MGYYLRQLYVLQDRAASVAESDYAGSQPYVVPAEGRENHGQGHPARDLRCAERCLGICPVLYGCNYYVVFGACDARKAKNNDERCEKCYSLQVNTPLLFIEKKLKKLRIE